MNIEEARALAATVVDVNSQNTMVSLYEIIRNAILKGKNYVELRYGHPTVQDEISIQQVVTLQALGYTLVKYQDADKKWYKLSGWSNLDHEPNDG